MSAACRKVKPRVCFAGWLVLAGIMGGHYSLRFDSPYRFVE
jgi:hypothetical protein